MVYVCQGTEVLCACCFKEAGMAGTEMTGQEAVVEGRKVMRKRLLRNLWTVAKILFLTLNYMGNHWTVLLAE